MYVERDLKQVLWTALFLCDGF